MNLECNVPVTIDVYQLIDRIILSSDYSINDLVELVKHIDYICAEWEFTETLYEYFNNAHDEYLKEIKNDEDVSDV